MDVRLLYFDECPHSAVADERLQTALACRGFVTADGRAGLPTVEQLVEVQS